MGEGEGEGEGMGEGEGEGMGSGSGSGSGEGGEGGEGGESGSPQDQETTPIQERIREAEKKMREAQQKLEEANREGAAEAIDDAVEHLEDLVAELEELLRQLREEEIERMLAMLEARFRKMLEWQVEVYEGTLLLADVSPDGRQGSEFGIQAGRLSFQERKIAVEAERALELLREEGSSVAFPEAVEQMLEDMIQVTNRLSEAKVGNITQDIEIDIIAALEETIEALQKAQQEQEPPPPGDPPPPLPPADQALLDQLAELKMIRALQMRINRRHIRYARLLTDVDDPVGQTENAELLEALQRISEREARILRVVRDIVLGRNQ